MIKKKILHLLFSSLFICSVINAISSEAIEVDAAGSQIVLINDIHVDLEYDKKGPMQRKLLLDNLVNLTEEAKKEDKEPVFVIVEDQLTYDGPNKKAQEYIVSESLRIQNNAKNRPLKYNYSAKTLEQDSVVEIVSVLANLTRDCHDLGIDCYNAEARQVKWVSRNIDSVTAADVAEEFEFNTQAIMNDLELIKLDAENNTVARVVYEACIKIMEKNKEAARETIDLLQTLPQSLKQLTLMPNSEFATVYNPLFDTNLVDARILISWYNNRARNKVVIVAGEVHTENVLKVFESLDYSVTRHGTKFPFDPQGLDKMVDNCIDVNALFEEVNKPVNKPQDTWNSIKTAFNSFVDTVAQGFNTLVG
jgi:hypothetical protein